MRCRCSVAYEIRRYQQPPPCHMCEITQSAAKFGFTRPLTQAPRTDMQALQSRAHPPRWRTFCGPITAMRPRRL